MASGTGRASSSNPHQTVRADSLVQVEPDHGGEFVVRPYSLTPPELGGLPAALAGEPKHVLAWVRYPAIARHVHGLALAWTPRAVYVEWEDAGIHRAWVWAPAVERAAAKQSPPQPAPPRPSVDMVSVRDTKPLVELINAHLTQSGSEFVTAMAQPAGPFGAVVFGSIEGHSVRLEFSTDPATNTCSLNLFGMTARRVLAERVTAPTFPEAIEAFPWAAAMDALDATTSE
ncbi:hypothetical protein E3O42_10405 [Cryobacterium adonitolivorans]|uniref:Uncharacterized protein n=1 Tax=Cryobacterium adonitolivorans TaxID=1259189 RepID=A0A4R8W6G8_9MICO|nr:hypothetical protein [Cryobacterium adonitolivorans]TFC01515.1 hypothetical protein E3O42_10405 [Cryobacterium adonitolivorans]